MSMNCRRWYSDSFDKDAYKRLEFRKGAREFLRDLLLALREDAKNSLAALGALTVSFYSVLFNLMSLILSPVILIIGAVMWFIFRRRYRLTYLRRMRNIKW